MLKTPEAFADEIISLIPYTLCLEGAKKDIVLAIKVRDFDLITSANDAVGGTL